MSYSLINNTLICLVLQDSHNFTQVHNARQTRPLISAPMAHVPIEHAGCVRLINLYILHFVRLEANSCNHNKMSGSVVGKGMPSRYLLHKWLYI